MVTGATAPIVPCFCVGGRSEPAVRAARAPHRRDDHNVWEGAALPNSPTGWGMGKPGFPIPCVRARPSRGRGDGGTWFPYVHVRRSCAWRTTPAATGPGARAGRPRHGSAGTAPAPSLTLPHWEREPGASPQRGEAGRGAERCARWSPQPDRGNRRARKDGCAARLARSRPGPGGCGHRQARVARVAACERVSMGPPDSTTRR